MNYYLKVLYTYFTFSGRARRSEYWYFVLFNMIFAIVAIFLDNILGTTFKFGNGVSLPYGYTYLIYTLIIIVPSLAVSVRRLHDVGKSGWFLHVLLIPLIGTIWLLILLATDSNQGENKYGTNPKHIIN